MWIWFRRKASPDWFSCPWFSWICLKSLGKGSGVWFRCSGRRPACEYCRSWTSRPPRTLQSATSAGLCQSGFHLHADSPYPHSTYSSILSVGPDPVPDHVQLPLNFYCLLYCFNFHFGKPVLIPEFCPCRNPYFLSLTPYAKRAFHK